MRSPIRTWCNPDFSQLVLHYSYTLHFRKFSKSVVHSALCISEGVHKHTHVGDLLTINLDSEAALAGNILVSCEKWRAHCHFCTGGTCPSLCGRWAGRSRASSASMSTMQAEGSRIWARARRERWWWRWPPFGRGGAYCGSWGQRRTWGSRTRTPSTRLRGSGSTGASGHTRTRRSRRTGPRCGSSPRASFRLRAAHTVHPYLATTSTFNCSLVTIRVHAEQLRTFFDAH